MKSIKVTAFAMAVLMLHPMLLSCAKNKSVSLVKEDDPWYESYRFKLQSEKLDSEMLTTSVVSYSDGKLCHLYSLINLADYDNYNRTILDTYDEGGNLLNRIELDKQPGFTVTGIDAVRSKDGNTIEAVAEVFTVQAFETSVIDIDIESGEISNPRFLKDKDGNRLEINEGGTAAGISEVFVAGEYLVPVIYTGETADSIGVHAFSFKDAGYMCELDFTGIPSVYRVDSFSFDPRSNLLVAVGYTASDGPVLIEFDADTGARTKYGKYDIQSEDKINIGDYKTVDTGELYKIDNLGNITTFDPQTQETRTVIDNNWYTPYFYDLSLENVNLVTCSNDIAVIHTQKETGYSMVLTGMDETVTILKRSDKNPHAGKKVIELATPGDQPVTEYLSDAIFEFNRTDSEYLIRVWSKYKEGIVAGRNIPTLNADDEKLFTMIQELNGTDAPDIAIGIQKNYAMRDDVFEDLTGYLDQETADQQFANIIEASKIGDKHYFLPVTIEIEGLVTDTSLIEDGACGITFEDFDRMIKEDLDGFSPYDYPMSEYYYRKDFILSCIDTKSAIEGSSVDFGTAQFYAAIEYSADSISEDGFTKPFNGSTFNDELKRVRTGCRYDRIGSYLDFVHACRSSENEYTIIGTPSVDASGPRFRAKETISVTSVSDVKDGAKKFINFLFSGAGYGDSERAFSDIVTNKKVMERNIAVTTEKNNAAYETDSAFSELMSGMMDDYNIVYGFKPANGSMERNFMASLSTISIYYYDDPVITAFLVEEIAPYYAGDRTLDASVTILNDRVNTYIKEM